MLKPAVFLDRDGILNSLVLDEIRGVMAGPTDPAQLILERQAAKFVRALNDRGYLVLITTDQPMMAQGRLTNMLLDRIHARLRALLAASGGRVDGVFFCPHDPDARAVPGAPIRAEYATSCRCRRPAPGLILRAASTHQVDLARSFMVCRSLRDVKAGRAATVETVLMTKARLVDIEAPPELRPNFVAADLTTLLGIIDNAREITLRT